MCPGLRSRRGISIYQDLREGKTICIQSDCMTEYKDTILIHSVDILWSCSSKNRNYGVLSILSTYLPILYVFRIYRDLYLDVCTSDGYGTRVFWCAQDAFFDREIKRVVNWWWNTFDSERVYQIENITVCEGIVKQIKYVMLSTNVPILYHLWWWTVDRKWERKQGAL